MEFQYCHLVYSDNELYHHGIKGMHWGIRRYQNPNGSLTSEGRARVKTWKTAEIKRRNKGYYKIEKKLDKRAEKLMAKRDKRILKRKDTSRIDEKVSENAINLKINKALQKAEVNKIKKMSINDIHQAKINKAKFATKQSLKLIGKTALATAGVATGLTVGAATSTSVVGNMSRLALKRAATRGLVGGIATVGAIGGSGYGEYRSIKTALGSKKRYSNLTNNEKAAIIEKYIKQKKRK